MEIQKFVFDAEQKRELFGLIGEFCVDATLRTTLGAPITSSPGDIWLVGTEGDGVVAFGALTLQKNGLAKLHALHGKTMVAESRLRKALVTEAKDVSANALRYTAPARRGEALSHEGWTPGMARGQYITFEKAL